MKNQLRKTASLLCTSALAMSMLVGCGTSSPSSESGDNSVENPVSLTCAITMSEDSAYYKDWSILILLSMSVLMVRYLLTSSLAVFLVEKRNISRGFRPEPLTL